jgi:hypothetical protein
MKEMMARVMPTHAQVIAARSRSCRGDVMDAGMGLKSPCEIGAAAAFIA